MGGWVEEENTLGDIRCNGYMYTHSKRLGPKLKVHRALPCRAGCRLATTSATTSIVPTNVKCPWIISDITGNIQGNMTFVDAVLGVASRALLGGCGEVYVGEGSLPSRPPQTQLVPYPPHQKGKIMVRLAQQR